jgi:hypothetical protein
MCVEIPHDWERAVGPFPHDQRVVVSCSVDACVAQRFESLDVRLRGGLVSVVCIARLDERVEKDRSSGEDNTLVQSV